MLSRLIAVSYLTIALYLAARLALISARPEQGLSDRVMAVLLLGAELFLGYHAAGFFLNVARSARARARGAEPAFAPFTRAPVAVLVAAYNEPEEVLDETLAALAVLDYPSFSVYLLDDSTRPDCRAAADSVARRYGATLVRRPHRTGYKAGAMNELLPRLREPYVAVLDADQRPVRTWLTEVVPYLEAEPRLAFIQVPQVYDNLEGLPVAQASQYRQAVFFEYICEGKSTVNAVFCCGSNVVFRRQALLSVGRVVDGRTAYFDETSVTEDFATTVDLHSAGWRTRYLNRAHVLGLGPETLPAYFTQQMRWAMGSIGVGLRLLRRLFREPRALTPAQWWEYLLSGTYYFTGVANLVFMLAPVLFLAGDVRPLELDAQLYLLLVFPHIGFNLALFFAAMRLRGVPVKGAWMATALAFATFWTYSKAALLALLGRRRAFGVTPKGVGGRVPLRGLVPELLAFTASGASALAAVACMLIAGPDLTYAVNGFWAAYNAIQLSILFIHFNRPVAVAARSPLLQAAAARA
ncbi:MAG TPA: glycosyltransferase [Vicinamibacteria bacterium]|nr:glycosyltransferase [Vicinamibacteria bacterium]